MEIINIFLIIFALFAWSRAIINYKKKRLSTNEFIFWTMIWILVMFVSILPGIFGGIADLLGTESGLKLLVYLSIIILFYLIYRLYVTTKKMNKNLTLIVRRMAINYKNRRSLE